MPEPVQPTSEQMNALDTLIDAMQRGEITPTELSQELKAPVNEQQGGGDVVTRAITTFAAGQVGLTLIVTLALGADEDPGHPRTVEDLPDEISLEELLAVRRRLTST